MVHNDSAEYATVLNYLKTKRPVVIAFIMSLTIGNLYAQKPELVVQQGHGHGMTGVFGYKFPSNVKDIAISQDGYLIATTMPEDATVKLWDMQSLKLVKSYALRRGSIKSKVSFFPDNNRLLTTYDNENVTIDLLTDSTSTNIGSHAALSPDGRTKCYYSSDYGSGILHFFDTKTSSTFHSEKIKLFVRDIVFSADSRFVALASTSSVLIYNITDRLKTAEVRLTQYTNINKVRFCLNNDAIVCLHDNGNVTVTNIDSGKTIFEIDFESNKSIYKDIHVSKDGKVLTCGGQKMPGTEYEFNIEQWHLETGLAVKEFDKPHPDLDVDCFDVHEESGLLVCVSSDRAIRRFDFKTGRYLDDIPSLHEKIIDITCVGSDLYTLSDGWPNTIKKWSFNNLSDFQHQLALTLPYVDGIAIDGHQMKLLLTSRTSSLDRARSDFDFAADKLNQELEDFLAASRQKFQSPVSTHEPSPGTEKEKRREPEQSPAVIEYDLHQLSRTFELPQNYKLAFNPMYTSDGNFIFYAQKGDRNLYPNVFYYQKQEKKVTALSNFKRFATFHTPDHMAINHKLNHVAFGNRENKIIVADLAKRKTVIEINQKNGEDFMTNISVAYSHDGKRIAIGYSDELQPAPWVYSITLRDTPNYLEADQLAAPFMPTGMSFSHDDKFLLVSSSNNTITVYNLSEKKIENVFLIEDGLVKYQLSDDTKTLYVLTTDGKILIYDCLESPPVGSLITSKYQFALISSGNDFFLADADGFYACTRKANQMVGFRIGSRAYPLEQFDLVYNRPDIVFQKLVGGTPFINNLSRIYKKRAEIMDVTSKRTSGAEKFSIPELNIANARNIPTRTNNISVAVHLMARDTISRLKVINAWVGDNPLFGLAGLPVMPQYSLDTIIHIELSGGNNKIDISVSNENSLESLRSTINVFHTNAGKEPNLYVVSIGTSNYLAETGLEPLPGVDKNANLLVQELKSLNKQSGQYANVYDLVITNNFQKPDVRKIEQHLSRCTVNDVVLLFVSGHGIVYDGQYYYMPYNVSMSRIADALDYFSIEQLLGKTKSRKKMLILNTCMSGDIDTNREDLDKFDFLQMKDRFLDIRKTCGATVFSSARSSNYTQLDVPLVTYIIEGLRALKADSDNDKEITVNELCSHMQKSITENYPDEKPEIRFLNLSQNFRIW